MTIKTSVAVAIAALAARTALVNAGHVEVRSGTRPATPETAPADGALLATLTFGDPAFADPVSSGGNAVATADPITEDAAADATGNASWFRVYASDNTPLWDGDCGTAGADMNLVTTSIVAGQPVQISSWTLTQSV